MCIHTAHVYFSQIVKLSAILCIFRTNWNSNSGMTVHFHKLYFLRMVLVCLHQLWYSTVEIERGRFHQRIAYLSWKKRFFYAMSAIQQGNDTASDVYDYLNENKHD